MKLVQVGSVGRPHGYRGEFLLSSRAASGDLPETVETIYIGPTDLQTKPYRVLETTSMPRGLRLKLEGFDSDTAVKALSNAPVFIDRSELPEAEPDEFYVNDLVGCGVQDAESGTLLGVLTSVEAVAPGSPDRWWVTEGDHSFAFPAIDSVLVEIDLKGRLIRIENGLDFQNNQS
jgi:16S rRNA processing protein RimM